MGADIHRLAPEIREAFIAADKEHLTPDQERWRFDGKTGVLSCGFGVSGEGLRKKYPNIPLDHCKRIVDTYRTIWAPGVKVLWYDLQDTGFCAMQNPGKEFQAKCGVRYWLDRRALVCRLLNGKEIYYPEPELKIDPEFGKLAIYHSVVRNHQWCRTRTWYGTLCENVVSAHARELLAGAMLRAEERGFTVVLSVHDELVIEGAGLTKELIGEVMSEPPEWAVTAGIPIAVDAWIGNRYRK